MECNYNIDKYCMNKNCPTYEEHCPVPDTENVCQYEDREDKMLELTPKGCFYAALLENGIELDNQTIGLVWDTFTEIMLAYGYIEPDDEVSVPE